MSHRINSLIKNFDVSLLSLSICCGLYGCSSRVETVVPDQQSLTLPTELTDSGESWKKSPEFEEADVQRLSGYFQKHPSLAEGSLIRGQPTVYTNSGGAKRFYWVDPGADEPEWLFIQFKGSKATLHEGRGAPFTN